MKIITAEVRVFMEALLKEFLIKILLFITWGEQKFFKARNSYYV